METKSADNESIPSRLIKKPTYLSYINC